MFQLPKLQGLIRRRLLVNFRADPIVVQRFLPAGFQPKLHGDFALVGICLIRLEQIRPKGFPSVLGLSSENAAHRVAVTWRDSNRSPREGVFVPRRDTNSRLNAMAGGRVFPGEHHHSRFTVQEDGHAISLDIASTAGDMTISVRGRSADQLPATSCFASLEEASAYFAGGCVGYSATCKKNRLDGIELQTDFWRVHPLEIEYVASSFFQDPSRFPAGSITFDHCLIMRDIPHEWHSVPDFHLAL